MTDIEKMVLLKEMTGETDESILSAYLAIAKSNILLHAFPYSDTDTLPSKYDSNHIEIAAYLLNKRGAEGETRHSENGIDRTYDSSGIPYEMLRKITPMAGTIS